MATRADRELTLAYEAASTSVGPRYGQVTDEFRDAGFTHTYVHQVGPDQEAFFRLVEKDIARRSARDLVVSG